MSILAIVFLVFAVATTIWQFVLLLGWYAMIRSGKYSKVTVGVTPGIVAVMLWIVYLVVVTLL